MPGKNAALVHYYYEPYLKRLRPGPCFRKIISTRILEIFDPIDADCGVLCRAATILFGSILAKHIIHLCVSFPDKKHQ